MNRDRYTNKLNNELEVVIHLEQSINSREFDLDKKDLIQRDDFEKVIGWIDSRLQQLPKAGESKDKLSENKERLHDTISILGSRGSGKTSFLLSILKYYRLKSEVETIDVIDPTLIEEKGHIFLTIISQIKHCVDSKIDNWNSENSNCSIKQIWRDRLNDLALGIPSIDGISKGFSDTSWQDAEYIMDRGLKSVGSARKLQENFDRFVELSLQILGKKMFIIALDDIDIDFCKGWPVLETIRKYLTTPRITILLSGDIKLFSKAIRKQQWKNFGKALLKNEGEILTKISEYNDHVTEMEGQYLQKVMHPERRINLKTIKELVELNDRLTITIIQQEYRFGLPVKMYYDEEILPTYGIRNNYEAEAYSSALMSLPLRTQIQLWSKYEKNETREITDIFLSDLYEKQVNVDLVISSPKTILIETLRLLLRNKSIVQHYQLQPTSIDISLNNSMMALNFLYSQRVQKYPALIFDYFIRIGYIRNIARNISNNGKDDSNKDEMFMLSIDGLCEYAELYQDKVLRDVVGNITAYVRAYLNIESVNERCSRGTLPLRGLASRAKQNKEDKIGRIDFELEKEGISSIDRILAYIPLNIIQPPKSATLVTYSVYTLLGTIGELILRSQFNGLINGLNELSQIRTYYTPTFNGIRAFSSDSEVTSEENGEENLISGEEEGLSELERSIAIWIRKYPKRTITPHLLGKISTRFYNALGNIDESYVADNLGDHMHIRIIALMNAILVEDVRENAEDGIVLNLNNVRTSDKYFIDNLRRVNSRGGKFIHKLYLSKWLLSCPLLGVYVNLDINLADELDEYLNEELHEEDFLDRGYSIYNILKNVDIKETPRAKVSQKNIITDMSKINLPKFTSAQQDLQIIVEKLKTVIEYYKFMNMDRAELQMFLSQHFSNTPTVGVISNVRHYIKNDSSLKW